MLIKREKRDRNLSRDKLSDRKSGAENSIKRENRDKDTLPGGK
jgi:hypothetical protein